MPESAVPVSSYPRGETPKALAGVPEVPLLKAIRLRRVDLLCHECKVQFAPGSVSDAFRFLMGHVHG